MRPLIHEFGRFDELRKGKTVFVSAPPVLCKSPGSVRWAVNGLNTCPENFNLEMATLWDDQLQATADMVVSEVQRLRKAGEARSQWCATEIESKQPRLEDARMLRLDRERTLTQAAGQAGASWSREHGVELTEEERFTLRASAAHELGLIQDETRETLEHPFWVWASDVGSTLVAGTITGFSVGKLWGAFESFAELTFAHLLLPAAGLAIVCPAALLAKRVGRVIGSTIVQSKRLVPVAEKWLHLIPMVAGIGTLTAIGVLIVASDFAGIKQALAVQTSLNPPAIPDLALLGVAAVATAITLSWHALEAMYKQVGRADGDALEALVQARVSERRQDLAEVAGHFVAWREADNEVKRLESTLADLKAGVKDELTAEEQRYVRQLSDDVLPYSEKVESYLIACAPTYRTPNPKRPSLWSKIRSALRRLFPWKA